jgi:lysophospholipase L1-like esterase
MKEKDAKINLLKIPKLEQDINSNSLKIGDLSTLNTTDKTSVVNAINENTTQLSESVLQGKSKGSTSSYHKMLNGEAMTVVCKGDSVTWGALPNITQITSPFPSILQTKLRFIYGNDNITVINSGIAGHTASQGLSTFQTGVINLTPNMVVIMYGLNDADQKVDLETYKSNLREMVKQSKDNNIEVILCSPTPMMKNNNTNNTNERWDVASYAKACKELALELNVDFIDIFEEFQILFKNNAINSTIFSDTIHLVQSGYELLSDIIIKEKLASALMPKLYENQYVSFYSPYVFTNCATVYTSSSQKLYYNFLMDSVARPTEYIKFLVYNNNPDLQLKLLNYQDANTGTAIVKNFGTTLQTLTLNEGIEVYDIGTTINIGIGLYCLTITASDLSSKFAPSGYYLKNINSSAISETGGSLTLANSWVNLGSGFDTARYKKIGNLVTLTGVIKSGTNGSIIATLPAGYRPTANLLFATTCQDTTNGIKMSTIQVSSNGDISIFDTNGNAWRSLCGISFYVD